MSETKPYIVSARKYRPATFRSVVGQKALTSTLKNAVDSGRLAQAYLFCGPRGVGKTSCARIFARTINCMNPDKDGEACGKCESCLAMEHGTSFNVIELDAASNNSVDDIRALCDQVRVPPQSGRYRVFIIDEVHMLTSSAFNAFLKTLEEPPSYVIFILATTEKHKVIPTILSRCQVYDFKRITVDDMADHLAWVALQEGVEADPKALDVIARKADGAMRDALSIFDQVSASTSGHVSYDRTIETLNVLDYEYYFRLTDAFAAGDVATSLLIYKDVRDGGFDSQFFLSGLADHVRSLMVAANPQTIPLLETAADTAQRYASQAASLPLDWYYAALKILGDADVAYRTASNRRLCVEVALIRLCQLLCPSPPPFDRISDTPPLQNPSVRMDVSRSVPQPHAGSDGAEPVKAVTADRTSVESRPAAEDIVKPDVRPAGRPVVNAAPAAPARRRPHTARISGGDRMSSVVSLQEQAEEFTDTAFMEAWGAFIALHPHQRLLVSAMRDASPLRSDRERYSVKVDHPAAQQAFEGAMGELLGFLRGRLRNDRLTLSVEINTEIKVEKMLPPNELLKDMVGKNRALADFLSEIDGEIA